MWLAFLTIVVSLLAFDLGVLHKGDREIGVQESLLLSAGYITVAVIFGAWVWWYLGSESGMAYYTGFMIEKSLSMDNVFVIALIFTYFAIPRPYQHRVLFWGILGVIVLRAIMIGAGRGLGQPVQLGALPVRRIPDAHRHQDVGHCRPHARHCQQSAAEVFTQTHAGDRTGSRQCFPST